MAKVGIPWPQWPREVYRIIVCRRLDALCPGKSLIRAGGLLPFDTSAGLHGGIMVDVRFGLIHIRSSLETLEIVKLCTKCKLF